MKISSIILSGGRATRMGGIDKGLVTLIDKPLIAHVIARLSPQVDEVLINANRQETDYLGFDLPILQDQHSGFIGPLAGVHLGLSHAKHDYLLTVPCDSPLLHDELANKLMAAMIRENAEVVVAKSDGQAHPVFALYKTSVLPTLTQYIEQGERKVSIWQKSLAYFELDLSNPNGDGVTEAFINVNTSEDLSLLASTLSQPTHAQNTSTTPSSNKKAEALSQVVADPTCIDDYDPNSMPVSQARNTIAQYLDPVESIEILPIRQTLGRVLARDILAPANVPNYDNSAMDGFAFNANHLKTPTKTLKVVGTAMAGQPFTGEVKQGECIRIMTGAMMPAGTDTVVMQEHTKLDDAALTLTQTPSAKMNVRYAGEDIQQNQVILKQGDRLKPADIGLLASLGIPGVDIFRQLKVAIFSTGDELVSIGQKIEQGQVYDSNRYTLFGMLQRLGVDIIDLGAIPDNIDELEKTLLAAAKEADVVITSGGVSVGAADYMKALLQEHGRVMSWKLAMKPGRPLAYGKLFNQNKHAAHYFGLPGNPVAVMVTFYQFVREALLILMGQEKPPTLPVFKVICTESIRKMPGRTEYQRGIAYQDNDGEWKVKPTGAQGSAILSSMSAANCFIVLDEATGNLEAGSEVNIQMLEGLI